jgi:hypothetical protein
LCPSCGAQGDFDSPVLRVHYCSLRSPDQTIDFNMDTKQRWGGRAASACEETRQRPGTLQFTGLAPACSAVELTWGRPIKLLPALATQGGEEGAAGAGGL